MPGAWRLARFFPAVRYHTITYFMSLLVAMMVKTGIAIRRGPTGFKSVRWKLAKKASISVATWDVPAGCYGVQN